jgi:RecA/RadA recombinase
MEKQKMKPMSESESSSTSEQKKSSNLSKESNEGLKFVRKKSTRTKREDSEVEEEVKPTSVIKEDFLFDEIVKGAQKYVKDVFVASEDEPLLAVNDWIKMPKPIRDVMGTPGIPCGLITMVYGKKDCGKTTFATEALASTQREGGISILLDTEHKYSLRRAKAMGLEKPIIIRANTIEEAFDKFVAMINFLKNACEYIVLKGFKTKGQEYTAGEYIDESVYEGLSAAHKANVKKELKYAHRKVCCVWDSLGATPSMAELDENVEDFSMTAAKVIKGRLRKLLYYIKDMKVAFVIINQVYANMNRFGKKTTPYGGSGPEYHSAIILEFAKLGGIRPPGYKSPDPMCGITTEVEVVKNHLAQPFKRAELQVDWRGFIVDRDAEYAPEGWGEENHDSE